MIFKKHLKNLITAFLLLLIPALSYSQIDYHKLESNIYDYNINQEELLMIEDAKDGEFNNYDLIEASFIAEGITDKDYMLKKREKIDEFTDYILNTNGFNRLSDYEKAELILRELHSRIFRVYSENETTVREIITSGRYNCVSSAILYNHILNLAGIECYGAIVPSHAFSVVKADGKMIEVQTTSPGGFDPNASQQKEFEKLTGFDYVSVSNTDVSLVDSPKLIAVMYSNLAVFDADRNMYEPSLTKVLKAVTIYPEFKDAINNIVTVILRWTQYLVNKSINNFENAVELNTKAIELFPEVEDLKKNTAYLYSKYTNYLNLKNEYIKSIEILNNAIENYPDIKNELGEMLIITYINYAGYYFNKNEYENALAVVNEAQSISNNNDKLNSLEKTIYKGYALHLSKEGNNKATDIINDAINEYSKDKNLKQTKIDVYKNLWTESINNRKYENALSILEDAKENSNISDRTYNDLYKNTYIDKINKLVKDKSYDKAFDTLEDTAGDFKNDNDMKRTVKYVFSQFTNNLITKNIDYEKAFESLINLIKRFSNEPLLSTEAEYYLTEYVKDRVQKEYHNGTIDSAKEKLDYAYSKFPTIELNDLHKLIFTGILMDKLDTGYDDAITYFFDSKYAEDDTTKNVFYNKLYEKATNEKVKDEAMEIFEDLLTNYDKNSQTISSMLLGLYTDTIKLEINRLYKVDFYKSEKDFSDAQTYLENLITHSKEFLFDNGLDSELQKFYIIVSVEYFRVNNLVDALMISKEGFINFKDNEILKNNTIGLYLERAKELVKINKDTETPYQEAILLLQDGLQILEDDDQILLNSLLTKYIEESNRT